MIALVIAYLVSLAASSSLFAPVMFLGALSGLSIIGWSLDQMFSVR